LKLKAVVIAAVFALGVVTSVAVAKGPPPGKGKGKHQTTSTSTSSTGTTTTADKHALKKMWICHRTGSGKYVKMRINRSAWPAHKRHGDASLEAAPGSTGTTATTGTTGVTSGKAKGVGSCAGAGPGGSTTGTTTTSP
jgi:hypothetical protein